MHADVIDIAGGADGIRDLDLLDSALGRPMNQYAYGETDLFQLAASFAEAIARNHPFVDGNKRTAFQTAAVFLLDNGYRLIRVSNTEHADMMVDLAQGLITRETAAQHLRDHSDPLALP